MNNHRNRSNEICIIDSSKILKKEGFTNLCQKYGLIKNVTIHKKEKENRAFIEFEDKNAINQLLRVESELPSFIKILTFDKINREDIENCEDNEHLESTSNEVVHHEQIISRESIYYGPNVSGSSLIEESKELKSNDNIKFYNLENDELFGKPLSTKWENIKMPEFEIHNLDFNQRFKNCTGGEIKLEKKLSPNSFTGWTTFFNDGENIQDKLKSISTDIEFSDHLNIENLKKGMLVGAFDCSTYSYCRGYVVLISGNSVNVALCDYGRVINTIKVRLLPEKYTQIPAFSFKVFTKGNNVPQLKKKPYVFKVCSVTIERIVLTMFDEDTSIKVQLKKWQPSVEESGVPYIDFKSGSSVELLKLKDMSSVCLRSKEKYHLDTFFSIWNTVAVYCFKNPQPLNRMPLYGEIVGFKSTLCNNYVRARIHKNLGNNIYSVKHMDNPIKENIKLSDIIELTYEQKSIPVSYLKVELKGALPYPIQFEAKKFIDFMIGVPLSVHFDESTVEGWRYVDLNVKVVKENLNAILFGLAEPMWLRDEPTDIVEESNLFCKYSNLLMYELKNNLIINMKFVMYHDGIFYMRDKEFGKSFLLLSNMIKEYCSLSLNPYLPHCNEICLGQFPDGMWYRVLTGILKPGELTKVYSIDLGNVAYLIPTNMKKLPLELNFHPAHVYQCMLDIPVQISAEKFELLQKYENTDCEVTIVKNLGGKISNFDVNNYDYLIKCPFLENILK